jgi:serine/threonine-protein kinase HSL1, negative regulator of Swe1 kinase
MDSNINISHAKITVHRNGSLAKSSSQATNTGQAKGGPLNSTSTSQRAAQPRPLAVPAGLKSSRRSMTSIQSTDSTPYKRPVSRRHRRGVDFSHAGKNPKYQNDTEQRRPSNIVGDDTALDQDVASSTGVASRNQLSRGASYPPDERTTSTIIKPKKKEVVRLWNDELSHFSYSIAKDCDEAFNSSLLLPESYLSESSVDPSRLDSGLAEATQDARSLSATIETPTPTAHAARTSDHLSHPWDTRPLPPAPPPTDSVLHEIMLARRRTEQYHGKSDESPGHADRVLSHLDRVGPSSEAQRRVVSAPIYSQYSGQWEKDSLPLPSIREGPREFSLGDQEKRRNVSAPTGDALRVQSKPGPAMDRKGLEFLARQEETIRVVQSPSGQQSPVRAPAPLNVRKRPSTRGVTPDPEAPQELDPREESQQDEIQDTIPEEPAASSQRSSSGLVRKKSSWFKRTSKEKDDVFNSKGGSSPSHTERARTSYTESNASTTAPVPPAKKKNFSLAFWRSNHKEREEVRLSIGGE